MVDDHHCHNSESIIGSSTTTPDVASQSCNNKNINNPNNNNSTSSPSSSEKTCRRFKAKDFWRIYGTLIVRLCHVARNNNHSSIPTSPFSSPPPPERPPESSSTSSSSSCCSNINNASLEEGDQPAHGVAPGVDSQRVEQVVENNTMNGIHSFRYTTTAYQSTTTAPSGTFKQKSKEKDDFLRTITNPLSRIASKRSPSPTPKSSSSTSSKNGIRRSVSPLSFVHRRITGRKPTSSSSSTPPPADGHHDQYSSSSTAALPPSTAAATLSGNDSQRSTTSSSSSSSNLGGFPRIPSQRSTTPIMFSNSTGRKVKPPPVQHNLECTLEELFYGCTKKVKVTRDVLTDRGQIVEEEEMLSIQVKPGWRRGTKITFQGMGNERLGSEPADVTFVIVEKRHSLFERVGDDLEIAIEIPLVQALTGCDISIPLISSSGETMNLVIQDIIYPGYQKIIPGQGMPKSKEGGRRGNLRVLFLVEFPDDLTEEQRSQVVSILEEPSS